MLIHLKRSIIQVVKRSSHLIDPLIWRIILIANQPSSPVDTWIDTQQVGISLYSIFCILSKSPIHLKWCTDLIGLTCFIDFHKCRPPDIVFHHIITILMTSFVSRYIKVFPDYTQEKSVKSIYDMIHTVLAIEIPTLFLVSDKYCTEPRSKIVIQCSFAVLFFYYRIFRYRKHILLNPNTDFVVSNYTKTRLGKIHIYSGIYGMYLLNWYWFCVILMKGMQLFFSKNVSI